MTSRRPMIRTYSSNGRTSSFSEEEGSSSNGRSESRNTYLSNVRPENRSTLCSVMAQLTEDIQPSFERTLKSKAVSENCNVKFTCVVSGYPAPELKWYKDDREMDRYCGLPKYEIHRNGKTHTLHIYNCTLDDAAIYQVSASNSKGIVSCSGVLEVGDMNEYKIHQRFFSKLKQKAENKKKNETEAQSKKTVDKENIQKAKQQISPERPPRKRHVPPPAPSPAIKEAAAVEQQGAAGEINGVSPEVMEAAQMPFKDKETDKDEALSEKALATKKMKISNGVDAEVDSSNVSAKSQELRNGGENCYDGGIGLAQFLAETLQSQTSEENQSSAEGDSSTEMALNASNSEDKEKEDVKTEREEGGERQREECERQKGREEELATEKGKEMEKLMMASQIDLHAKHSPESKQHCKAHKDLEHHNIQASISSMLHSVKDFLFGKSKKDSPDPSTNKICHSVASHAEMPPSFQLQQESNQASRPISGDRLPMEIDRTKEPQEVLQAQNVSLRRQGSRHEGSVLCADQPPANKLKFETMESSIGQSVKMPNDAAESMEISAVPESCSPGEEMPLTGQVLTEADAISVIGAPDCMEISSEFNNQAASDESEDKYVLSETQKSSEDKSTPTSVEAYWTLPQSVISVSEHKSNNTEVHGDILQEKESGADEKRRGPKPEVAHSDNSSSGGQKAEVKFNDVPQSDINRHEIIQLSFSAEERIESCEFEAQNQVRLCSGTANVETKLSPKINELTRGSPVAAASDSLEKDELSKRQESTVPGHEERPEVRSEDSILSPILDLGRHKDRSKLADVFAPELEVKLSRKQERPEVELVEGEGCTSGDEEYFKVAQQESREVQRFWPAGKIPKIQISSTEDLPDIDIIHMQAAKVIDHKPANVADNKPAKVIDHKPATVIDHKPAKVIDHKPANVADNKPAKVIDHKPATVIDHKPANVADNKPAKVIDHKPATVIDHKPANVVDNKPANVADNKPAKMINNKPATVIDNKPATVIDNKPATLIDNKPATVINNKPATVIDNKPATVIDNKPATVIDNKPATLIDNKPATVINNKPAKMINNKPATVIDNKPATVIDNKPATVINNKPATVIDNKPATVINNKPAKMINNKPATVIDNKPATVIDNKPATVINNKPATVIDNKPATVIDNKPATVINNKPAKMINNKPATVIDNKPATVIDNKPATFIDNKPAKVVNNKPTTVIDNKPATVIDNKPATVIDKKPATVIDNEPAKVVNNKPTTVIDNKPATVIDNKPTTVIDNKPATVIDNKPATVIDNKPTTVIDNKPATVIDNKPAKVIDNKPATFIDIKPATVIDNKSSTVIDNKPFKVINRNPSEGFITPQIEVMEPMLKEGALLAMKKRESESAGLQQRDATPASAAMPQQQEKTNSLLWQRRLQDDCKPPAGENVAQSGDKMESSGEYLSQDNSSVRLPQMATVPVINVSCIDPKQDEALSLDGHSSDGRKIIETPAAPAFVVPPISVTSHDGECALKPSTQNDSAETESTVTAMRVTKQNVDNAATEKSDKPQIRKQSHEEATEKRSKESTLSAMGDGFTPNVGSDGSSLNKTADDGVLPENTEKKTHKEAKIENFVSVLDYQRNHPSVDRLASKPPTHPSLSPSSLRKFMSKAVQELDIEISGGHQSDKPEDDLSGGSTPTLPLSCESSPRMKRRDSLTLIRSATPEELASGARRKIFMPRPKEDGEGTQDRKDSPYMSPSQARRAALLQCPTGQSTPPMERRSPLVGRRMDMLAVPKFMDEPSTDEPDGTKKEEKQTQKKLDPLKAPQVIRKIRAEPFPDASGHLKLWCQFFNVLLDSTIKWFRDEEEILEMRRSGGDESQAALAIILAASQDCGVYGCSISNEYGADTTDFLLSVDVLSQILLKDELEVGEEIEMTPLLFTKGLADWGSWGEKYFGRIMTETLHVGSGCAHKASRVRVIYGLDPIFESGSTCIVKVGNPVAYGTKPECSLAERNGAITKQECKVQNTIREYCKIFAAEARVSENFGFLLEVIPQYLIYRPANSVPYATVEADLKGQCLKHCTMDPKGKLITQTASEVEQKCSTFQHWIHQWTHGNLLVTQMEGVETKLTNIRVVTKSKGYQGLTESGSPEVFEQFLTHHQCNYYCGLLGLIPLKTLESLQPPKAKGSRSPLLNRKLGSSSPQMQRKGQSPQMSRKANSSPKVARKVQETEDDKSGGKSRLTETSVEMR
ncbi:alpha-protein kinase 3 isoform X2 [Takifugu rubripes]|uniref:alpha-protein kinase 3 isoform X2 n=1 Tax=Takifugu rubripes TaxID=31033 RepID=UPI0011455BB0|nr:alpha-protein kinase 3 isoform X2 [Takifugu rubripes]